MEMMDTNENVTDIQVSQSAVKRLGGLQLQIKPMKTTWKDLSPTHRRDSGLLTNGHLTNDNQVPQGMQGGPLTLTNGMEQNIHLEEGPVIRFETNTVQNKTEDQQAVTLPRRSRNRTKNYATWKDLSPTKKKEMSFNRNMSTSCGGTPRTSHVEMNSNQFVTWKDLSPTKMPPSPERSSRRKKRPESGYFSNDVQSEGQESREGIDTSLSESESGHGKSSASSPEEGCFNNDYFYDEDFIVQFDTNIRDGSVPPNEGNEPETVLPFPHSLNGSYTRFGNLRDSFSPQDLFFGPYESELSGSRTSMEISSSEREMMCSSDMLDFSNDPLFTPTPTSEAVPQHFSVDSLARAQELNNSRTSADANLSVDCCPRKEEYFLSFDASHGRMTASSSYASQSSSQEAGASCSPSCSSNGEEAEEVCSDSFHYCQTQASFRSGLASDQYSVQKGGRGYRLTTCGGTMEALHERSIEKSQLSDLEKGQGCASRSSDLQSLSSESRLLGKSSLSFPARSPSCYNLASPVGTLRSSEDMHYSDEVGHSPGRIKNFTSWRHVKNLKKFSTMTDVFENSRCSSLPDLTQETQKNNLARAKRQENLQAMADSFHNKRHSASLLEMYQRMKCQSNPASPETVRTVEKILFPQNGLCDDSRKGGAFLSVSRSGLDHVDEADSCSCGYKAMRLELRSGNHDVRWDSRDSRYSSTERHILSLSRSRHSKETAISPNTVTLWQGTKNFAAQFPPKTQDCGIQTSIEDNTGPVLLDHSMQTSPHSPQKDIVSILNEVCGRESRKPQRDTPDTHPRRPVSASEYQERHQDKAEKNVKRSLSLSPSRMGKNSFYTHRSLPDLSFLSSTANNEDISCSSLFDPVQIPIILTPVVDDSQQTQFQHTSCSSCSCQKEARHGGGRSSQTGRPFESGSSSSGFSTSSTSSGIDAGYCEPRCCHALAADLERILFLPPHLESVPKFFMNSEQRKNLPPQCRECPRSERKFERYTFEAHPGTSPTNSKPKTNCRRLSCSSSSNSTSSLHLEGLYSVKEEQSPTSPDKQNHMQHFLDEYTAEEICHGLTDSVEDKTSITRQIYEHLLLDRKPLKSCLRKKTKGYRSRSLSNPDSLCAQGEDRKPPKKPSRHSIACDGIFPQLVNEEQFENANFECMRDFCQGELPPLCSSVEEVVAEEKIVRSCSSSFEDANRAKKSVSFASEVSFQSPQYSPQCSPKRQPNEKNSSPHDSNELSPSEGNGASETRQHAVVEDADPSEWEDRKSPETAPSEFAVSSPPSGISLEFASEISRKRALIVGVAQAAEALVAHFTQARDPFDKLRLGSSADNPGVGALVVSCLGPAVERVVMDGMKPFLTGFHVFGKIHITPWRVAEMSSEIGPYTRAVNELVRQLKMRPTLMSNRQKFYAFLVGLLNLRLLDFWMGYIRSKKNIVDRVYEPEAILCLSETHLQRGYSDMLLALQPLAVLPFQLELDIACQHSSLDASTDVQNSLQGNNVNAKIPISTASEGQKVENVKGQSWSFFGSSTFPRAKTTKPGLATLKGDYSQCNTGQPISSLKTETLSNPIDKQILTRVNPVPKPKRTLRNEESFDQVEREDGTDQSPISSITNLAQKFIQRTQSQDRAYRRGVTEYSFSVSGPRQGLMHQTSAPVQCQTQENPMLASGSQQQNSPRGPFNIISFFDKLLLPEKNPKAQNRNSWSEGYKGPPYMSQNAAWNSGPCPESCTENTKVKVQGESEVLKEVKDHGVFEAESEDNTECHGQDESVCSQVSSGLYSELRLDCERTEVQSDSFDCSSGRNESISQVEVKEESRSMACASGPSLGVACAGNIEQILVNQDNTLHAGVGTYPNMDINANSPDFHPESYAIVMSGPTKQMEESDQTDSSLHCAKASQPNQSKTNDDAFGMTSYRYVVTLVSCDADDTDHLAYDLGEYLEVLAQIDDDWLFCANGQCEGLVRIGAIQPLTDDDMFETLHDNFYR